MSKPCVVSLATAPSLAQMEELNRPLLPLEARARLYHEQLTCNPPVPLVAAVWVIFSGFWYFLQVLFSFFSLTSLCSIVCLYNKVQGCLYLAGPESWLVSIYWCHKIRSWNQLKKEIGFHAFSEGFSKPKIQRSGVGNM